MVPEFSSETMNSITKWATEVFRMSTVLVSLSACAVREDTGDTALTASTQPIAVVNAANYGPDLAPGTLVAVFGSGLSSGTCGASSLPLPTILCDVSVEIAGGLAPLLYVSSGQINLQVPYETPLGQVNVVHVAGTSRGVPASVTIQQTAPGLLTQDSSGAGLVNAQHAGDYSLVTDASPISPGEALVLYAIGLGAGT